MRSFQLFSFGHYDCSEKIEYYFIESVLLQEKLSLQLSLGVSPKYTFRATILTFFQVNLEILLIAVHQSSYLRLFFHVETLI